MESIREDSNETIAETFAEKIERNKRLFWQFLPIGYFAFISFIGVKTGGFIYNKICLNH